MHRIMIEHLFPKDKLEVVKPPRMDIGSFTTFKGYDPLGIGNQAVHNSGSSMLIDTPTFKVKVLNFINEHFKFSSTETDDVRSFISIQVDNLIKFKKDISFRKAILTKIFPKKPFDFNDNIESDYLYISLVLFFVCEYNFLKSTHNSHSVTKENCEKQYSHEQDLLSAYYSKLTSIDKIDYLSDVCYGRYYFLEVHFLEKDNPRSVPLELVGEYLLSTNKNFGSFDLLEQKEVQTAKTLDDKLLDEMGNRNPESQETKSGKRYKTNPRISKTVLEKAGYKCQVDSAHTTFYTTKELLFTEAHHLIPMSFQKGFLPINLDRKENIISICPTCHRAMHLGNKKEKEERLKILLEIKRKELKVVGLELNLKNLMDLYV